ncbi:nucleotidyltransferase [Novosphingobium sp. PC22D]|uniref:nucleotidyltransferase domain-containing protein n=1 Tax=Novosphingobium sp. PC22D TaxID=1962403 RepID=UPI000BF0692D|nr:nucleotidyltransferase [Novosphingobium sp. PC22D]PEQ10350.1 nucleotidyltransferase [Novosphingobium sp. PC22D]
MATAPARELDTSTLDEILLDLAVLIELSPHDREIAENRYRRLKEHVERPTSPLRPYLVDGESLIYAQGSVATSTTILSGDNDDRFDVDAIVEIDVPLHWSESEPLDQLFDTLKNFPGAIGVVRCTRCVQVRFAFMHMDVTIMDRRQRLSGQRPGHIFHSPDTGSAYRVDSNPWGFTGWFRTVVGIGEHSFEKQLKAARDAAGVSRLIVLDEAERRILADAEQVPLPPMIPSRIDAQEAVALKLLKRYLNLCYARLRLKRPPSIWLTKLTGDMGLVRGGLTLQLYALSKFISNSLREHLARSTVPREANPSYPPDKINDRWPRPWPEAEADMSTAADHLDLLADAIEEMNSSSQSAILKKIDQLFGERFGQEERRILKDRYDRRNTSGDDLLIKPGSGTIYTPAIAASKPDTQPIPQHRFHPGRLPSKGDAPGG